MNRYLINARIQREVVADSESYAKDLFEEYVEIPCYDVEVVSCVEIPRNYWEDVLKVKRKYLASPGGAHCAFEYGDFRRYYLTKALERLQSKFRFSTK